LLDVIEYFAETLKVSQGHSKWHSWVQGCISPYYSILTTFRSRTYSYSLSNKRTQRATAISDPEFESGLILSQISAALKVTPLPMPRSTGRIMNDRMTDITPPCVGELGLIIAWPWNQGSFKVIP